MKYAIALMIVAMNLVGGTLSAFHYGSDPVGNVKEEPRTEECEKQVEKI